MAEKLAIGDTMPEVTINLVDGSSLALPSGLDSDMTSLCLRQFAMRKLF